MVSCVRIYALIYWIAIDINNALEPGKRINEDIVSYVVSQGVSNLSPEAVKEMI